MKYQIPLTLLLTALFLMSGCLDSLNDSDSSNFWGDDCSDDKSDCPENPAPAFVLINQNNEVVNLSQFEGKVVVMTFLYTNCPEICPAITYQMKRLAEELGDDYEESVVFLSVTVDPERDTAERLSSFSSGYNVSWDFLTVNSSFPENHMQAMWTNYNMVVLVEEDACGGQGHYMEGYEGCHCNPGYIQDSWNVDMCIEDPDYEVSNLTFEDGSIENDIIQVLDAWSVANANDLMDEEDAMALLDSQIYNFEKIFAPYWAINDINDTAHKSTDYYNSNLTLLEFFHTDCGHCSAQIPALKEFHSNYSSEVNVISVGGYGLGGNIDNLSTIQEFTSEHNVSWTYLYDEDSTLMSTFGLDSYPSWVLLEGNMETGEAQIVGTSSGTKSYDSLVEMVTNHTVSLNVTEQMDAILENIYHWRLGHVSDSDMLGIIASALNYEFDEEDIVENYGVTHSSRLYIIDQNSEFRVLWKGTDWTYASIYHDIQILL